jgi:class 3 adenylate cyclase
MSSAPVERKLAAILSADVAGYSRIVGKDEAGTLAALSAASRGDRRIDPPARRRPLKDVTSLAELI